MSINLYTATRQIENNMTELSALVNRFLEHSAKIMPGNVFKQAQRQNEGSVYFLSTFRQRDIFRCLSAVFVPFLRTSFHEIGKKKRLRAVSFLKQNYLSLVDVSTASAAQDGYVVVSS